MTAAAVALVVGLARLLALQGALLGLRAAADVLGEDEDVVAAEAPGALGVELALDAAHAARGGGSVQSVQPAVGTPREAVERFVRVFEAEAVEHDFGRAVGHEVAVAIGQEQQLRGSTDPDAAEADAQPADEVELVVEDGARLEAAVAVLVLEHEDGVVRLLVAAADRVAVGLGDPQAAALVEIQIQRLLDQRLLQDQIQLQARCHLQRNRRESGGAVPWCTVLTRRRQRPGGCLNNRVRRTIDLARCGWFWCWGDKRSRHIQRPADRIQQQLTEAGAEVEIK